MALGAARASAPCRLQVLLLLGQVLLFDLLIYQVEAAWIQARPPRCEDRFLGHCTVCEACCVHLEQEVCEACVQGSCEGANQCDAGASGGCNVCDTCCRPWFAMSQEACDSCAAVKCHTLECSNPRLTCSGTCLFGCWGKLEQAPCVRDCMEKHSQNLFILALLPFLGRLIWDWFWGFVKSELKQCCMRKTFNSCCGLQPPGGGGDSPPGGVAYQELSETGSDPPAPADSRHLTFKLFKEEGRNSAGRRIIVSWEAALRMNGMSCCAAFVTAATRLLLWHCLQPIVYVVILVLYWGKLNILQQALGALVAVREAQYFLLSLVCTFQAPSFLLIDIGKSAEGGFVGDHLGQAVEEGRGFLTMYVLAPDKFVALVASKLYYKFCSWLPIVSGIGLSAVLDGCSCVALVYGLCTGTLPPALAAGYVCTAISVFSFGLTVVLAGRRRRAGQGPHF